MYIKQPQNQHVWLKVPAGATVFQLEILENIALCKDSHLPIQSTVSRTSSSLLPSNTKKTFLKKKKLLEIMYFEILL